MGFLGERVMMKAQLDNYSRLHCALLQSELVGFLQLMNFTFTDASHFSRGEAVRLPFRVRPPTPGFTGCPGCLLVLRESAEEEEEEAVRVSATHRRGTPQLSLPKLRMDCVGLCS